MRQKLYQSHNLPPYIKDAQDFIWHCLNDLFFLCTYVLAHGKKHEYKDLNHIHMQVCDWMDWWKNPILQKLLLMSRDSLKSTLGRGMTIQELLRALIDKDEFLIGVITGGSDLSEEHLKITNNELLMNEMLQAYFADWLPKSKEEADEMSNKRLRWRKVGIDIGSLKKSLSGRHYRLIWFDNFMNEVNSITPDLRRSCRERFKSQGPLLRQGGYKLVSETPWEPDDLSGEILDPNFRFDYRTIHRKSPALFETKTGYSVFACGARNEHGQPNFPAIGGDQYLLQKRAEMGEYLFKRQYELLPIASEDFVLKPEWFITYESLPYNYIRNLAVDCAGTKARDSSYSALSLCDWDHTGEGYVSYAAKYKFSPMELFKKVVELYDQSKADGRPITTVVIEREKYGIYLKDHIEVHRPDIYVDDVALRGKPRNVRLKTVATQAEKGNFKFRKGLKTLRDEWNTYHLDKDRDVDILDTLYLHLESRMLPSQVDAPTFESMQISEFEKQIERDRANMHSDFKEMAGGF